MTINILFEQLRKPNVYPATSDGYMINFWSGRHRNPLPVEFHHLDLNIVTIDDIDSLDYFIYPVILNEPYYFVREFFQHDHPFGFYNRIHEKVLKRLDEGTAKVYVSMTAEYCAGEDLSQLIDLFKDFDDRLVFNLGTTRHYVQDKFLALPTWTELHEHDRQVLNNYTDTLNNGGASSKFFKHKEKRKYCLLNGRYKKHFASVLLVHLLDKYDLIKDGYVWVDDRGKNVAQDYDELKHELLSFSPKLSHTIPPLSHADDIMEYPLVLSQAFNKSFFNIVVEAYYLNDLVDYPYITEKTWRCFKRLTPFVLIGQRYSLKALHDMGYKTFSPFINENYDNEEDSTRIFSAFKEIFKLIKMSDGELDELLINLKPIFEHNQRNYEKRKNSIDDYLRSLKA